MSSAYELKMGDEVYITGATSDVKQTVATGEQIAIPPGQFALLLTEESVRIPDDAIGFISIKFRFKKYGLVNVSGFHVDPGWDGKLQFSVYNAGPKPIPIERGVPTFLLWYASLESRTTELYAGTHAGTGLNPHDVQQLQGEVTTPQALLTKFETLENEVGRRVSSVEEKVSGTRYWVRNLALIIIAAVIGCLVGLAIGNSDEPSDGTSPSTTVDEPTTVPTPTTTSSSTSAPSSGGP